MYFILLYIIYYICFILLYIFHFIIYYIIFLFLSNVTDETSYHTTWKHWKIYFVTKLEVCPFATASQNLLHDFVHRFIELLFIWIMNNSRNRNINRRYIRFRLSRCERLMKLCILKNIQTLILFSQSLNMLQLSCDSNYYCIVILTKLCILKNIRTPILFSLTRNMWQLSCDSNYYCIVILMKLCILKNIRTPILFSQNRNMWQLSCDSNYYFVVIKSYSSAKSLIFQKEKKKLVLFSQQLHIIHCAWHSTIVVPAKRRRHNTRF